MASRSFKMIIQGLKFDRISGLPQNITGNILTRMPIRDAIRTGILSRKWRSRWKSMTKLVFNEKMVNVPSNCQQLKKYKLMSAILNVLLLHTGSIVDIRIEVGELDVDSEFDQIICYLSRNNSLQKFCFLGTLKHCYKLPSSFYSLQGLESIGLINCLFKPPTIFDGFSKLHRVAFRNVDITSKTLQLFLSNCPLLRNLALMGDSRDFTRGNKLTFVELLQCVPLIEILEIRGAYMEGHDKPDTAQISKNFPDIQDYSGFTLDHLDFFLMENFANKDREVEFLKLIMAKSPMLKKAQIKLDKSVSIDEENKMLRNLLQLPFPRASPSAKLIIERPKPSSR